MQNFKAAIFDLDGTLVDSMGVWKKVDIEFLKRRGLPISEDYTKAMSAKSYEDGAKYTIKRYSLNESVQDLIDEWNGMARDEYRNNIGLKHGVAEYLHKLKSNGIKLAVATSSPFELCEAVLKSNGIFDMFDAFANIREVNRSKEFPDIYLLAAQKLNIMPDQCVVFEDILHGVKSAKSAGMTVYGIYDKSSETEKEEIARIADKFIYNYDELI